MKKFLSNSLSFVALLLAHSSCVQERVERFEQDRVIIFDAFFSNPTKSISLDDSFKVWGLSYPAASDGQESGSQAEMILDAEKFDRDEGIWRSEDEHLWCSNDSKMGFFAISPSDVPATFSTDKGVCVNGFDMSASAPDLKFATLSDARKPQADLPTSIVFRSALCDVEFRAKSVASDDINITITKVTLSDVVATGDFCTLPSPEWTLGAKKTDLVVFEGNMLLTENAQSLGEVMSVIPQNLKPRITLRYNFDSGMGGVIKDIDVEIKRDFKWRVGKKRIYTFKVSQNLGLTSDIVTDEEK